ncbi:hypothetical protein, partial [Mycobacteroides abscessus]|uniref:hypothetical protein n=1 Tax=Mycobacteroides abscessus TaxID=36809 RepID=UPI0019D2D985
KPLIALTELLLRVHPHGIIASRRDDDQAVDADAANQHPGAREQIYEPLMRWTPTNSSPLCHPVAPQFRPHRHWSSSQVRP